MQFTRSNFLVCATTCLAIVHKLNDNGIKVHLHKISVKYMCKGCFINKSQLTWSQSRGLLCKLYETATTKCLSG